MSSLEHLSHSELVSLDQGGPLWHRYRDAVASSLYFASKAVLTTIPAERNAMSRRCHLPICLVCEDESITRLLVEWPRRHMKSTIATVHRPIQKLAKLVVRGLDPCTRFALYSSTTRNAQRHWRDIKNIFDGNELFRFLFPELIPPDDGTFVWNTEEGEVPRIYRPKEPTFDTLGGGKATGRHYDDICLDDMIDEENFDSPTAVEKAIEYYRQTRNLCEDPDTSRITVVGNRWGMSDLNSVIHSEEPHFSILSASCWGPNIEGRYRSRNLPEPVNELLASYSGSLPLWPERFSKDSLGRLLTELKPRIFSAQYLNNPNDPDAVDFKLDWLRYCDLSLDAESGPVVLPEDDSPVPLTDLNLYITWDPALDGKHSESENAIIVTAIDHHGRIYVLDEFARKADPLVAMDDFLLFARKYQKYLKASGMEEVLFQKVLGRLLEERAQKAGIYLGIRRLKTPTGMRKDQRIRAWTATKFESRLVYVRRSCNRFIEQYSSFGVEGAKRDLIDAFAYATQLWTRPPSPEDLDREEEAASEVAYNGGVTGYGSALRTGTYQ